MVVATRKWGLPAMLQSAALERTSLVEPIPQAATAAGGGFTVSVRRRIVDVEAAWRGLTAGRVESPGQILEFVKLWIEALRIPDADCVFVLAEDSGTPIALLPLHRRRRGGVRTLGWFPGSHVSGNAPIVDRERLAAMPPARRRAMWLAMLRAVPGADLVELRSVPELPFGGIDLFAELGESVAADTLYRASFESFEEADRTQRNKSRRKHDRQQGEKLEAMGTVGFEAISNGPPARLVLDTMFRQRALRFREMGVADPFSDERIRQFYDSTVDAGSGLPVLLHVLELDGEIVAIRYNIVHGDRLFCLISSMSEDPSLRPGSPGKQCLLRVMHGMFDAGYRVFDMGEGLTDEKRHWCNVRVPVRTHYLPITRRGAIVVATFRAMQRLKTSIKSDPRLLALAKRARSVLVRTTPAISAPNTSDDT